MNAEQSYPMGTRGTVLHAQGHRFLGVPLVVADKAFLNWIKHFAYLQICKTIII
jgi:hypothetical protein